MTYGAFFVTKNNLFQLNSFIDTILRYTKYIVRAATNTLKNKRGYSA